MALRARYRYHIEEDCWTFIIAAVIIGFIDSPFASPEKCLKLIVEMPNSTVYEAKSGIDVVYHQILSVSLENADQGDPDIS
jgi:hypothetical protein